MSAEEPTEQEQQTVYGCLLMPTVMLLALLVVVGIPLGFWFEGQVSTCAVACGGLEPHYSATNGFGCLCVTEDNHIVRP